MCHRAGKVQGYRRQHCSRIREWRSQAKLCREPTMCVREGECKRVRAGGGARAGEGRVGVGRGGKQGEAGVREGAQARSSQAEKLLLRSYPAALPPARRAPCLTRRAWPPLLVTLPTTHGRDRKDLLKKIPNDRSRLAANSSFLFWALFPLPLLLSFLEKLAS